MTVKQLVAQLNAFPQQFRTAEVVVRPNTNLDFTELEIVGVVLRINASPPVMVLEGVAVDNG